MAKDDGPKGGTEAKHKPQDPNDIRTTDQLRAEIDAGLTGDKDAHNDPAAAPLGADAEAGGRPTSQEELQEARRNEIRRGSSNQDEGKG